MMSEHMMVTNNRVKQRFVILGMAGLVAMSTMLVGCVSSQESQYSTKTSADLTKIPHNPKEIAKIRTAIASQMIRDRQLDSAKRQLEQALASDDRYAPAYDMMGILLQQEGSAINLQKAEGYFKQAISLDPQFIQARNNYGVYLSQMKRYNEALQQFEIAGSALGYEGRAGALENLGRTALQLNKTELATQSFIKALDTNRQSIIARIELVDIFLKQKSYQDAQMLYSDLTVLMGNNQLGSRVLLQGIRLAKAYENNKEQQRLTQQLFDLYPTSDEAKQMKTWLSNPGVTWN